MKQQLYAAVIVGLLAMVAAPASAAVIYGPDTFEGGTTEGWEPWAGYSTTTSLFALTDIGGGDYAMAATGTASKLAVKKVAIPQQMTIDMDIVAGFKASPSNNNFFNIIFHLEQFLTSGTTGSKHYELKWVKGYNPTQTNPNDYYGLQLWEKSVRNGSTSAGTYTMLAETEALPFDSDPHKVRITDDGTGRINVYFDDMSAAVLSVDDSASYSAGTANWLAVELGNQLSGGQSWFQNVTVRDAVVPEPMTALLLGLGGLVARSLRRRRA
jgi:hypothetical protein